MGVHVYGRACDINALSEIARRHGLVLLFDSAHALGCSYGGRMIGGFGNAEVFSFHATKFVNSLEGGAVVTNDSVLAKKVRLMKNFGFTEYDQTDDIGINGKMNEVSAAMGVTNLECMDEFVAVNYRNYVQYAEQLAGLEGISLVAYDEAEKCNYQYVVLDVDQRKSIVDRDQLAKILRAENVLARRYFFPGCHQMEPYRSYFPNAGLLLPETERLTQRVLCLPTGTGASEGQIHLICQIIRLAVENGHELSLRFHERAGPPK
jgi:dTDP-4-amino-4,6-dideoxygalactose transaminase